MKKSAFKNRIKSFWGKHKTTVFVGILSLQLAIGLTIYFLFGRISPNDEIFVPKEDSVAFLVNQNPRFSVDFGKVEQPDQQWVRFEAQTSNNNPFERKDENIFTRIAKLFQKKERYGIEMSLVGVNLDGEDLNKYGDNIIQVADVIGTDKVKTTTELIDSGREIGEYGDQEIPVSKQTVLNKGVANGVDLEYQIMKGLGLKEEIVIRDLEAYKDSCKGEGCTLPVNEFVFDLKMDGGIELKEGWFTIDGQSRSTYYFVDSKGRYVAHFLPNFAIDNINNKTFDVKLSVEKGEGNNYRAKVTVGIDWLLSGDRVFPIRIDPSIVHDDTADFSGGIFNGTESVTGPKVQIPRDFNCYGGVESTYAGYKIHTFFSSDTFTCNGSGQVEVLVVAGGGGGGGANSTSTSGGGGGAGGLIYNSSYSVSAGSVSVTVGSGGAGGANAAAGGDVSYGSSGGNSVFGTLTAVGGGGGGNGGAGYGQDGGSGGGAGRNSSHVGVGTSGQGTNGGSGATGGTTNVYGGGGGGGAGSAGSAGTTSVGGNGGVGLQYSLTGVATYFSGGGAGSRAGGSSGVGGLGGGGSAGTLARGVDGSPNTGGGGGGSSGNYVGGDGGSGIVIVRYPDYPLGGEYTSSSMDMGSRMSGATLSWTPSGVNTGDGETPYSTTGLVAQWNFNETSGTTAVSGGSCGTSCNGTLTNMTTSGQDAAVGTGWTANNRRWGAGALMFDGTNDYVSCTDAACGGTTNLDIGTRSWSISAWIRTSKVTRQIIVGKGSASGQYSYSLETGISSDGKASFRLYNTADSSYISSGDGTTTVSDNVWHHIVGTYDGTTITIYVDGIAENSSTTKVGTQVTDSTSNFQIGARGTSTYLFNGIIDSSQVYSRALSADEVLSNYQAGNIEFQYRVSTDNSTWSDWTSYDDGALMLDGSDDYVSIPDNNNLDITSAITLEAWVNLNNVTSTYQAIVGKRDASATEANYALRAGTNQLTFYYYANGSYQTYTTSNASLVANTWYHIVATFDGSTVNIYKNGTLLSGSCTAGTCNVPMVADNNSVAIGRPGDYASEYFSGIIDSVRIYSRVLNSTEISTNYAMADGESPSNTTSLVGYWELNERSGTSAANSGTCGTSCNGTLTNISDTSGRDATDSSGWSSETKRGSDSLWESFDNSTWQYAMDIEIEKAMVSGTSNLSNFPFLVSLSGYKILRSTANGGHVGQSDGGDIVFEDQSGNKLDHEIEKYDAATGVLVAWVKIPTLYYSSNTTIRMRYGNDSISDQWNPAGVWDSNYVAVWHMNQSSGSLLDSTSNSNNLPTINGTPDYAQAGKIGNTIKFTKASSEYFTLTGATLSGQPTGSSAFTTQLWFSSTAASTTNGFVMWGSCTASAANAFRRNNDGYRHYFYGNDLDATTSTTANTWYMSSATYDGTTRRIMHNGTSIANNNPSAPNVASGGFALGKTCGTEYWDGNLDEVRVSRIARSTDWIKTEYNNQNSNAYINIGTEEKYDSVIKISGGTSARISIGKQETESGLLSLWHFEEVSGSGAYILDSGISGNNITPTGTTYSKSGKVGGARSFAGSGNYFSISSGFSQITTLTVSMWFKTSSTSRQMLFGQSSSAPTGAPSSFAPTLLIQADGKIRAEYWTGAIGAITSTAAYNDDAWHRIDFVGSASSQELFVDGVSLGTRAGTINQTWWTVSTIGTGYDSTTRGGAASAWVYFNGLIDEVQVFNTARTADEIANSYRLGRDTYINKIVEPRDLSSVATLPIYIASDRPGSYINAIWGETGYANYQPDANTVGLWHLDEVSGTGAYVLNSAGGDGHGTPTGTTFTTAGKIGGARSFNGTSSDYISTTANYNFGASAFTISLWINPTSFANSPIPLSNGIYNTAGFYLQFSTSGAIVFYTSQSGAVQITSSTESALTNRWQLITVTRSGSSVRIYLNGQDITYYAGSHINPASTTSVFTLGTYQASPSEYPFAGLLDEVQVSNIARTADEIRQTYEVGLRTHSVNVKFGASLVSGNLITGSGDTSFSIDATVYGLDDLGSELYAGEKIIVKENYDGTEYIAQGTVATVNESTGAVTVSSWDSGSTFPSGGYTVNADVFKWQREYIPIKNRTIGTQVDAINLLTFRITNGDEGRNIWLDDLRSTSGYLSDYTGETLTFSPNARYFQYKAIFSTWDPAVTSYISQVQLDYGSSGPTMDQIMRHGKWFNGGTKQSFWWVNHP